MEPPLFHDNSDRARKFFAGYKTKIAPRIPKSVKKEPQIAADLQRYDKRLNREWTRINANEERTSTRTGLSKSRTFRTHPEFVSNLR
jgi:hypothetical protein